MRSPGFSPISAPRRPTECGFCASVGAEASVKIDHRNPRDPRSWSVRIDDLPRARAAKLRFLAAGAARAERSVVIPRHERLLQSLQRALLRG